MKFTIKIFRSLIVDKFINKVFIDLLSDPISFDMFIKKFSTACSTHNNSLNKSTDNQWIKFGLNEINQNTKNNKLFQWLQLVTLIALKIYVAVIREICNNRKNTNLGVTNELNVSNSFWCFKTSYLKLFP